MSGNQEVLFSIINSSLSNCQVSFKHGNHFDERTNSYARVRTRGVNFIYDIYILKIYSPLRLRTCDMVQSGL